jgi:penicillin-binding protein A
VITATAGTAQGLQVPGVTTAGKTGTAQTGAGTSHAWIIGFAPAEAPRVAVAVIVEGQQGNTEQTGGRVAAPIGRAVLEAALRVVPE